MTSRARVRGGRWFGVIWVVHVRIPSTTRAKAGRSEMVICLSPLLSALIHDHSLLTMSTRQSKSAGDVHSGQPQGRKGWEVMLKWAAERSEADETGCGG